jgi:hypothetical protein
MTNLNGYRRRGWDTRVGSIDLQIPRVRPGPAYFPSFLEPRSRCEQAIVSVVTLWREGSFATSNSYYFDRHGATTFLRPTSSREAFAAARTFPLDDYAYVHAAAAQREPVVTGRAEE